jgi:putative GTP pyrophosphokinase
MIHHHLPDKATVSFILTALGIEEEALRAQGIAPETLAAIYNDFVQRKQELTHVAAQVIATLQRAEDVHMLRYRVKDPIHLIRKVIRKKAEYPDRVIDEHNYMDWINDLVGVRAMHLYKASWQSTGKFIEETWELKRPPIAYVRAEEDALTVQQFSEAGFNIKPHPHGYRALHYVIRTQPYKQRYYIEIQLRTLFEEGWSEIDHAIRYPDLSCSAMVRDLLTILNRFTGHADSIASFIRILLEHLQARIPLSLEKHSLLRSQMEALPITEEERQKLHEHLRRLSEGD